MSVSVDAVQPITHTSDQNNKDGVHLPIETRSDIREQLAQLGKSLPPILYMLLQEFWTWLTGKPYWGQQPLVKVGRIYHLITALLSLFSGIAGSFIILQLPPSFLPVLLFSWAYTVGGARKIMTTICHRCVHYEFFGDHRDKWLADILSTMLFVQDFEGYRHDHKKHHKPCTFASFEHDPDPQFLSLIGFKPAQDY